MITYIHIHIHIHTGHFCLQNSVAYVGFANNRSPKIDPKVVEILLQGHPQKDPPIHRHREVDFWHGQYKDALTKLFDRHKAEAGRPTATLEVC